MATDLVRGRRAERFREIDRANLCIRSRLFGSSRSYCLRNKMPLHPFTRRLTTTAFSRIPRFVIVQRRNEEWCIEESRRSQILSPDAPVWFALSANADAQRVKIGRHRSIWRASAGEDIVFVKQFAPPTGLARLKTALVGDPAQREWRAYIEAVSRGVSVVHAIAVGVQGGSKRGSTLISLGVSGAQSLRDFCRRRAPKLAGKVDEFAADETLSALAELVAGSHERGMFHRDGHPGNILVPRDGTATQRAVYMDLLGARFRNGPIPWRWAVRSLAALAHAVMPYTSKSERLRFLREYVRRRASLGRQENSRPIRSRLWRDVESARHAHAKRLARRRDRRIFNDPDYFAWLRPAEGWRACVVLQPSGREMPFEARNWNRTEADWSGRLRALVSTGDDEVSVVDDLTIESQGAPSRAARVRWTLFGSPHRREFLRCHELRHRDRPTELVLAFAERRRFGLIDRTFLVRPTLVPADSLRS